MLKTRTKDLKGGETHPKETYTLNWGVYEANEKLCPQQEV